MAGDLMIDILTDLVGFGCSFGADVLGYRTVWMKFTLARRVYWTGHITLQNDFLAPSVRVRLGLPITMLWYRDVAPPGIKSHSQ